MKDNNLHNSQFENLLKKSLLENSNDKLNQKIMDISANYVFEKPINTSINSNKVNVLINKHLSGIKKPINIYYYLKFIIPIILVVSAYLIFNNFNNNENNKNIIPIISENNEQYILNTDSAKNIDTKKAVILESMVNKKFPTLIDSIKLDKETILKEATFENKTKINSNNTNKNAGDGGGTPDYTKNMEYPDLYEAPAPVFEDLEINPDYKLAGKVFGTSETYPFNIKNIYNYATYYKNKPFLKGMDDFVYINNAEKFTKQGLITINKKESTQKIIVDNYLVIPYSLKSYLTDYKMTNEGKFIIDKLSDKQLDLILKPYYFSKYEVSNNEYKQFTDWVLKSNGYDSLPYSLVIDENAHYYGYPQYDSLKYPNVKPYLVKWNSSKKTAYKYVFFNPSKKILQQLNGNSICVAPKDTIETKYLNGFHMSYEINPFYQYNENNKNKAVTGVSYFQALAFLDWKTHFHQQQFDNSNVNIEITYKLPNIIERRFAIDNAPIFNDNNWLTDLYIAKHKTNYLDKTVNNYSTHQFHPNSTSLQQISNKNKTYSKDDYNLFSTADGIMWLDGNVSEWIDANYISNWEKPYNAHIEYISKTEEGNISKVVEENYNKNNDKNGQLIMGGNYIDYRKGLVSGKKYFYPNKDNITINKAGIYLKKFVDPHKQYSTVGFRYIIKLKDVEEKRKTKLLQLIGSFDYDKYKGFPEKYIKDFKKFDDNKFILNIEVTNGMWRSFLLDLLNNGRKETALKCIPKSELWKKYNEEYIYYFKELKYDELPVVNISHEAAQIFNKWLTNKFNNYALRKFAKVEFKLPTEKEWEIAARGGLKDVVYPWGGYHARNYKGFKLANFKLSPYYKAKYITDEKSLTNEQRDSVLAVPIEKRKTDYYNSFPDSVRIFHLEKYIENKITHQQFRELDDKYWLNKADLKTIINGVIVFQENDQVESENNKVRFINEYFSINQAAWYTANNFGIFDMCGNIAEMIDTPTKTKGGSWNSYEVFSRIDSSEQWNGKSSPMVGFRPIMIVKDATSYEKAKGLNSKTPPGVILINKEFGVDMFEITNADYRNFMYYYKNAYGKNSIEYNRILPDTNCWINNSLKIDYFLEPFKNKYLSHPAFSNYPVVGVSYKQVIEYCKWRSKVVSEKYAIYHAKHKNSTDIPKKVTYRLPTAKEWEVLAKEKQYYVKSNEKLTKTSKNTNKIARKETFGPTLVKSLSKNKIGIYGLNTNVSEMTSEKGIAKGGNWYQKYVKQRKDLTYTKPEIWLGFRCVVDIEY